MSAIESLQRGRDAFERRRWGVAYSELTNADRQSPLQAEDVQSLAAAAELTGREEECHGLWVRAHQQFMDRGEVPRAIRCAFHLIRGLVYRGDYAQGGGWLARAIHILDESSEDCVEQGYLLIPVALQSLGMGDAAGALATFMRVAKIAERFDDTDLKTLGRLGRGRSLVELGEVDEGVDLLDEAMVAVTAGEVSPIVSGIVYCATIEACREIFDLRRAQEWTSALSHWCSAQPDVLPFRGQCLIHRVEIMRLHGSWFDAMEEAERACSILDQIPGEPAAPAAHYQQAEIYRLRGEFTRAEESFRLVVRLGLSPQPGLARLRLAQGQTSAAAASIGPALEEAKARSDKARLLEAYVQIMLATGAIPEARRAANELSELAANLRAPLLSAMAAHADGSVLLAEGDAKPAFSILRDAWRQWNELDAPYEGAHARVLIGVASRKLGDEDTAQMELDAARWVFRQLGAVPDVAHVESLLNKDLWKAPAGLTAREVEVLRLVAAGKTNRAIATDLFLSEKTVARHLSNIFTKLDVTSRSAATAYAFQHEIMRA